MSSKASCRSSDRRRNGGHDGIYAVVARIPCGRVASYGQVAELAGLPGRARQVGYALHRCPASLPWHRVLRNDGRIALPHDHPARLTQCRRLEAEGISVLGGRVDMARHRWRPEHD